MRLSSNKNWSILPSEKLDFEDRDFIRISVSDIKLDTKITCIVSQAGSGKTTSTTSRIHNIVEKPENKKIKIAVYSKNHQLLREEYLPLLQKLDVSHIKGITYPDPITKECMCPEPEMVKLHNKMKNIKVVCTKICEKTKAERSECPYFMQDKKAQIILASIGSMNKTTRKDFVFIDENFMEVEKIEKQYKGARIFGGNDLVRVLKENDAKWIRDHNKKLYIDYNNSLDFWIKTKTWDKVEELLKFKIEEQIYLINNKLEFWYRPKLYDVFDLASNNDKIKIILLCATFNEDFFRYALRSYAGEFSIRQKKVTKETQITKEIQFNELNEPELIEHKKILTKKDYVPTTIDVKIFYTEARNKNTIVYNINPTFNYRNREPANMVEIIKNIHNGTEFRKVYSEIGCIGRMEFIDKIGFGLYYNAAEGSNLYNNTEVIVKTSDYVQNIDSMIEEYRQLYMDFDEWTRRPTETGNKQKDTENLLNWGLKNGGTVFDKYMKWKNESKNYDAIHRNRGLWNDYRAVIVFGKLPRKIYEEFTVKEFNMENHFIEQFIIDVADDTRNKNIQREKEEEIKAMEILKQNEEEDPKIEEDFMNIPEPIEHEPEEDKQKEDYIPEIPDKEEPEREFLIEED